MGRNVLIVGAGKSTSYLLDYFLEHATTQKLHITIADLSTEHIPQRIKSHSSCSVIALDVLSDKDRKKAIKSADIVISMLPPRFHIKVAEDCIAFNKHLVTASYLNDEIKALWPAEV